MWFLAIRHLTSRPKQTTLTLLGITLGSAAYIAISGMMLGFQAFMVDQLINNDSHIRISAREKYIETETETEALFPKDHVFWLAPPLGRRDDLYIQNPLGWFERLRADDRVEAYSPQIVIQTLVRRGKIAVSARMIGSNPERQSQVTNIQKYMTSGNFNDIGSTGNRVLVGEAFLKRIGANVGETLLVSTGDSNSRPTPFKIVGSFNVGVRSLDDGTMFGALSDVQAINQTPSRISQIALRLHDVRNASAIATEWSALSVDKVESWDQANEGILSVFRTQDIVRNSMTLSILIVAGFGIYNILSMTVAQKRREIAILRSIGFEPKDVLRLFFSQGVILGFVGGTIGVILGYFVCLYMSTINVTSQRAMGFGKMIINFSPEIYLKGFLLAFLSAGFASLLPARAAGRLTPIETIRSEGS